MRYVLSILSTVVLGIAAAATAAAPAPADLVLLHGKIHTEDASRSVVQALAVRGNIVLDRDIFTIDVFDLHNTQVTATYLDGREVYAAKAK